MLSSKQELRDNLIKNLERLSNEIITDPERLANFVKQWCGGFHRYSMMNMLLILHENQDATLCSGFNQWRDKHNRMVNKGEHGIPILAPMFRTENVENEYGETEEQKRLSGFTVVYVFDVSQTQGEAIKVCCSELIEKSGNWKLSDIAKLFKYPLKQEKVDNELKGGGTDGKHIAITIHEDNENAMLAEYFHEMAHCRLHWNEDGSRIDLNIETKELEAEAVSFLVCAALGFEHGIAKLYIGNWNGDKTKLGLSGSRVLKTAEYIIRTIAP